MPALAHLRYKYSTMSNRVPHTKRSLSDRTPYHVVMTFARSAPGPNWPRVREILFRWMREVSERYGCCINLAVTMTDHVHLIVETPRGTASLGQVMRTLASKVALEINRRWRLRGSVYRDRYFSRILGTLSELVRGIRYVAMNPVKAKRCLRPEDWEGSSVRDVIQRTSPSSPWRFRGWMFRALGFLDDPRTALQDILEGRRQPVVARGGRQQRLPFQRGLRPVRPGGT